MHGSLPEFRPHPLVRGGHAQTLAGFLLRSDSERLVPPAVQVHVELPDGDRLVLHDSPGAGWRLGDRVALLVHGLAGCHQSGYMRRIAAKLAVRGVRTFRMDMRGCGAGFALAQRPTHAGRKEDAAAAVRAVARCCPGSPVTVVGFSLGGNVVLNFAAEPGPNGIGPVDQTIAACPPLDLAACAQRLRDSRTRAYDRYFIRLLLGQLRDRRRLLPCAPDVRVKRRPTSLWEFDDCVTAPLCGFDNAAHYYRVASPAPRLGQVEVPTIILAAADDPLIPAESVRSAPRSSKVTLHVTPGGGHLGFLARRNGDADRRWLDWRIVEWVTEGWNRIA